VEQHVNCHFSELALYKSD